MPEAGSGRIRMGFQARLLSGSTMASVALHAIVYLLLPLSLPTVTAMKQIHCHCPMCKTASDETHRCCSGHDGICRCGTSAPDDSSVSVLVRDIESSPLSQRWDIVLRPDVVTLLPLTPFTEPALPVETPPPKA